MFIVIFPPITIIQLCLLKTKYVLLSLYLLLNTNERIVTQTSSYGKTSCES